MLIKVFRLVVVFCLFCLPAQAGMVIQKFSSGSSTVDNCPDATYDFAWTGDNTSGSTYGCFSNGGTSTNAVTTDSVDTGSTYGENGNGALINSANDDMCWAIDKTVTVGTLWVSYYGNVATTGDGSMVSVVYNSTDHARIEADSGSTGGQGRFTETHCGESTTTSLQTWTRVGYTWDLSGTDKHKIVWDSTNWADGEEDVESLTVPAGNWSRVCIGDLRGSTMNRETYIDNVYFINGTYEAADPMP